MIEIAILAKAPIPGLCKTRLIPALGATGAAELHEQLLRSTVFEALAAAPDHVVLWCTPDIMHPVFQELADQTAIKLAVQPIGDLGERMHQAFVSAQGPCLVIGTDCPLLDRSVLERICALLRSGENVLVPAEDGGYVAIGLQQPQSCLFRDMTWSTDKVAFETCQRAEALGLILEKLPALWDVDTPQDLDKLRRMTRLNRQLD